MQIRNVGGVSPGDMGQAIAARLGECGLNVHTALDGRSACTRALARAAGLADCGSLERLVATCDMVLSVLNPGAAVDKAREVAAAIRATGRRIAFADCNAVSPRTVREIDGLIRGAGGVFIDAAHDARRGRNLRNGRRRAGRQENARGGAQPQARRQGSHPRARQRRVIR